MKNRYTFSPLAKKIFKDIDEHHGRAFLVGGIVRDMLIYNRVDYHDVDVEVYGLSVDELEELLANYGNVNSIGKSFGILKLDVLPNFDFALPRTEIKTGESHQDFDVTVNQNLDLKVAASRRDLTINALMYEIKTGKIYDFFHGQEDIEKRTLRMVSETTFIEDPLRVLRTAQFASRLDFCIETATKLMCKKMVQNKSLDKLSKERVFQEYSKLLLSQQPSIGLTFLKEIKALWPCLDVLSKTMQRLDYHPEGDVWRHTLLVTDLAALCCHKTSNPLGFMWSALLHDIGKPLVTTPEGKAPGHNESGVQVFNQYFNHFFENKKIKKYIKTMIYYHMHLMNMVRNQSKDYSYYKLLKGIEGIFPLEDLVCMSKCDKLGRLANRPETISTLDAYVEEKVSRLGKHALKPIIDGKILIDLGFQPNDEFKELLDWAYDLQMRDHDFESIIKLLKGRQNGR